MDTPIHGGIGAVETAMRNLVFFGHFWIAIDNVMSQNRFGLVDRFADTRFEGELVFDSVSNFVINIV